MGDKDKQSILIAEDNPNNLKVLSKALIKFGYHVRVAMDGKTAVDSAFTEIPDMVMLDIHMPEIDGYEVCTILKNDIRTKDIPVIFVSSLNEQFSKVKAFNSGGVDYLTKPIQMEETKARIEVHLALRQKIIELQEFNKIMLEREMRNIELKKEVNQLTSELGKEKPYPEIWERK
ncbi:MAG: response regulator [Desulfobacterales bacterium]|nr:response regulator [Desulfobacterales bacterium]